MRACRAYIVKREAFTGLGIRIKHSAAAMCAAGKDA